MSNLLGAVEIRALAEQLNLKPTKKLGQNFVVDANTCRKIVKLASVESSDIALEIGPGLGSLTLALLEKAKDIIDEMETLTISVIENDPLEDKQYEKYFILFIINQLICFFTKH